ncbi:hypothetical protein BH09BAC3_BH09BAC3_22450 [soil metagenome]
MPNTERSKVVFDASPLRYLNTGLGQVSFYLIKAFEEIRDKQVDIAYLVHPSSKHLVKDFTQRFITASSLKRHMPPFLFPFLFGKYDLWHATSENTQYKHFSKSAKVLLTLHGLHFLDEDSHDVAMKKLALVQKIVDRSNAIAADSKYTADLVRKHLNLGNKPMRIIHLGVEKHLGRILKRPANTPDGKFIFSIGSFFERKNFHVLIPFLHKLGDYNLVLAGNNSNAYGDRVRAEIQRLGLSSRVILTGEVNEAEKYWLFENCSAFVFPSVSEGFGIPLIEAMQAGKPVFSSMFGSLPEIGSTHAFYWEHFDPKYMSDLFLEKMQSYHSNPQNVVNSKVHADSFSWARTAEGYLSFYADLIK